jgi:poly-beta-hydroxybutyrate-responsive repressor
VVEVLVSSRCRWLVGPGRWQVRGRVERFVEPAVLLVLAEGPRHGYELKDRVLAVAGADRADAANLYRLLRRLDLEGIVHSTWDTAGAGPARRVYGLTTVGRRLLDQWAGELGELHAMVSEFLDRHRQVVGVRDAHP